MSEHTETIEIIEADLTQPEQADALRLLLNDYAKDPMGEERRCHPRCWNASRPPWPHVRTATP